MHSDITKEDHEQSNYFSVIVVLYGPYTREDDYKGLNRTVTTAIYLTIWAPRLHNIYHLPIGPMNKHYTILCINIILNLLH